MSTALASRPSGGMDSEQVELIKRSIARGASDDELQLFLHQCKRTGLDPFAKQIYCIKRRAQDESGQWVERMETQVSIDGLRLIAERTDRYAPGREPTYAYDADGRLLSATAYVRKLAGGAWHEVGATARYDEFVQTKKGGDPTRFWARMPHLMLAKCAEALALRRAFPHDLSGLYTAEETGAGHDAVDAEADRPKALKAPAQPAETVGALAIRLDRWAAAQGLAQPGELTAHLRETFAEQPDGLHEWPESLREEVEAEVKAFVDGARRAKSARQTAQAAQE